jgi:hypothetical protein
MSSYFTALIASCVVDLTLNLFTLSYLMVYFANTERCGISCYALRIDSLSCVKDLAFTLSLLLPSSTPLVRLLLKITIRTLYNAYLYY